MPAGDRRGEGIGSSPRLRGTRLIKRHVGAAVRFIPAPAGNADELEETAGTTAVHPRACGERLTTGAQTFEMVGSSPRLRGTPPPAKPLFPPFRFIPAPAGNAALSPLSPANGSVHPRACGERDHIEPETQDFFGSSPRLRGTRLCYCDGYSWSRFIPAPAGNAIRRCRRYSRSTVHPRACGERWWLRYP